MNMKNVEDVYPLSPMQQGLLFHSLYEPGSGAYVEQVGWTLGGAFDEPAFERAWRQVIARHAPLRTCFFWEGLKQPLQVVRREVEPAWERHDWRGVLERGDAAARGRRLREFLGADRRRGFALTQAPLMRLSQMLLADDERQFVWTYHHLLLDGWSISLVLDELFRLYGALAAGGVAQPEPERPRPFREYIAWLQGRDAAEAEAFWRERLRGFVAPTPLGTEVISEAAAPGGESYLTHEKRLSHASTERLREFARRRQLTLSTLVEGAWALLLGRYSGEREVVFGTVVSGRPPTLPGVETMVGLFVNTLPARVAVPPDARCAQWLGELQRRQFEARRYEYSPLAEICGWCAVPAGQPLFRSLVAFDNAPETRAPHVAGAEIRDVFRADTNTGYPLALGAVAGRELTLRLTCEEGRFDTAAGARMLAHLENLLAGLARGADERLSDLPLLSDDERRRLLFEWNDTAARYDERAGIPSLFEARARAAPGAVALVFEGDELTYAELNRRANRLARRLISLGVRPETLVGLCAERSVEMVVGLLGVLKAGAAYVPLDPSYPPESVAFMLGDSGVPLLLTQEHLAATLPAHGARVVLLDENVSDRPGAEHDGNPRVEIEPESAAYAIYTSGSTGRPKAAVNTHRAITNRLLWMQDAYGLRADDRVLQKTPFSFDVSVWEFFWPLITGARLVLARPGGHRDAEYLAALIAGQKITTAHFVPSMLAVFLEAEGVENCRSLKRVICSGEALSPELRRRFFERSDAELHNLYGPTEAAVDVTSWQCRREPRDGPVLIGRPIANTQIYILDEGLRPVPVGVPGELHIGGVGLARGYVARPRLTAEKFIPHPFSAEPGARLYKTGDRARYSVSGDIEFLGRLDHQVKIRGHRIEPGELETRLAQHPSVREAVAVVRAEPGREQRLVAYVTAAGARAPNPGELRRFLQERLPPFMLPSAFVVLEELPLTHNGKIDRRRLPAPGTLRSESERGQAEPRNATEETLAGVWAEVLGVERVGVHDNFFELGGDSILSMQVVFRARQAGLRLAPKDLFAHQTVAELASVAACAEAAPPAHADAGPVAGPVPLTPIQRRFFEELPADPHHFNQAVWLEARQALDVVCLGRALEKLTQHHDALRLRFTRDAAGWRQSNAPCEEAAATLLRVDLSELSERERERAVADAGAAIQASLDLSSGPLLRAALFEYGGAASARLLLVIHHLAVDGVSWRILLEDLQTAYEQLRRGTDAALPPRTTPFKRWGERLSEQAGSGGALAGDAYWLGEAERNRSSPPRRLPLDFARGENAVSSARGVTVSLGVEETRALLQDVPRVYRTQINDVLLTALARSFARWTGDTSLLVNLEGHGREHPFADMDVTRTVGWFTALFPVRLALEEGASAGAALCAVKEQLRAVGDGGFGYGLLRYMCGERGAALKDAPRAEVCFNYLGQFDRLLSESALFRDAGEAPGATRSPRARRTHLLNVDGGIDGGRLSLRWTYSRNLHRRSTIERLARDFMAEVRAVVAHCLSPGAGGRTPSDFPLARLTQGQVDELARGGRRVEDAYPLSPMQEGLLLHALRAPGSEVYCEQMSFQLRGALDAAAFERAWQELFRRHAVLRTAFVWKGLDEPLQVVHESVRLPLDRLDWRGLAAGEQARRLADFGRADLARGFDFSDPPLMRLTLIRTHEQTHELVWGYHHILLDGWSVPLLFGEVLEVYEALTRGRMPSPPARRPYRDYIAWLRRQDLRQAEAFWRDTLRGATAPTPLACGRAAPRAAPSGAEGDYDRQQIVLPRALADGLRGLAREHHLTLNTLAQGAWALLLARYSGERDVIFGATVSGRPAELAGADEMIGLFINTLPVRARVGGDENVLPWLKSLQEGQAQASQYVHSPLAAVQSWSDVPRGVPLFESILVFENYPVDESLAQASGSLAIAGARNTESTDYPLTLVVTPGEEVSVRLLYDRRRFDRATATRMLAHFRRLLEGLAADAGRSLSQLPLLSEAETHAALVEWNDTSAAYPADACFHHLFEEQVRRTPGALAVSSAGRRLSYSELNTRANRLAHHLRRLGVGPEVRVGVLLERSLELVVARLAVLKAGGAYVSLDPGHPAARLSFTLEDARAPVLIMRRDHAGRLPGLRARVVCPEADRELIERESGENPDAPVGPRNLAYVYYTSGSTGRPKGVETEHAGLVNLVAWHNRAYGVTPSDRKSQISGLAFDASVWELWPYLAAGASAHIPDEETRASWPKLLEWMVAEAITVCFLPTPLAEAVMDEAWPADIRLRALLTGGDKLHRWPRRSLPFSFVNKYGPTEVSAVTTWAPMSADSYGDAPPPIGRPIANTRVYVLDRHLNLAPVGAPGELYIGGVGLARGYLRRPDLTAERFIPDPFSAEPGARLYKTGDLVSYLPDGQIDFLGRIDNQVKVRGYRIELGEIEAALRDHPAVREAVALARADLPGAKQLVAYFVASPSAAGAAAEGYAPTAEELRRFLKERLPEYMVPSVFISLDRLPLTPNGKTDRRALPAPRQGESATPHLYVAPRNATEETLAGVWAEVLGVERVGVHDNFFELGGDSILSIRIIARAGRRGIEISPNQIFLHPTVGELAEQCAPPTGRAPRAESAARKLPPRQTPPPGARNPADFPDADLSQGELDRLLTRLSGTE